MSKNIRLAFIGSNSHVLNIIDELDKFPEVECVALAAESGYDDMKAWTSLSPKLENAAIYDNWRQMLAKETPDIVVIGARFAFNGTVALEAIKHGCHIITEKPIASSIEQLKELENALQKTDRQFSTMLGMRCEPAYQTIKQAVERGDIGQPLLISAQKSYKLGTRPIWFGDIKQHGGTILWVAIHAVDFVRFTAGVEYSWVHAASTRKYQADYTPDLDTCGSLHLGLTNGGSAVITYDYFRPAAAATHGDDRLKIVGSDGIIETSQCASKVKLITKQKDEYELPLADGIGYLARFIDAIKGCGQPIAPIADVYKTMEVCLCARQSAESGKVISIPTEKD